jgi:hypothetical protein
MKLLEACNVKYPEFGQQYITKILNRALRRRQIFVSKSVTKFEIPMQLHSNSQKSDAR